MRGSNAAHIRQIINRQSANMGIFIVVGPKASPDELAKTQAMLDQIRDRSVASRQSAP